MTKLKEIVIQSCALPSVPESIYCALDKIFVKNLI
jgi:hypothetical protein